MPALNGRPSQPVTFLFVPFGFGVRFGICMLNATQHGRIELLH